MKKIDALLIMVLIIVTGCSLEKRHYRPGCAVNWNKNPVASVSKKLETPENNPSYQTSENPNVESEEYPLTASEEKINAVISKRQNEISRFIRKTAIKDSCDIIELKNNIKIEAKVLELNLTDIKFKSCGDTNGPDRIISKSEISSITYANGTKESMDNLKGSVLQEKTVPKHVEEEKFIEEPEDLALAHHAFVCGICSFIPVVGWIFGILSIIFGSISLVKITNEPNLYSGKNLALIGLCLGIAGLIAGAIIVLLVFSGSFF